jgi:hypothetical protein
VQLLLWIVVAVGLAGATRRRPLVGLSLALLLWSLLPAVASERLTGQTSGALDIHPASVLVAAVTAVAFLSRPRTMLAQLAAHPFATVAVGFFLAVVAATYVLVGGEGSTILVDQVLAPVLLFWTAVAFGRADLRAAALLRATIIGAVSLQCLLAVVEWITSDFVAYGPDYGAVSRLDLDGVTRWPGTTDHPLVLALAIGLAAPLTVGLRSAALRFSLLSLQVVGMLITQSRVGLAVMVLVVIYVLLRGRMSPVARIVTAGGVAVGVFASASSPLVSGVLDRIGDDGGSAAARGDAYLEFLGNLEQFWFTGAGLGANYEVASELGLGTSFESSFLMYTVDFGLLATLVYLGAMAGLAVAHAARNAVLGASVGALAGVGMAQTFSALAYSNLSGAFIWASIALVVIGGRRTPAPRRAASAHAGAEASASRSFATSAGV